MASNPLNFVSSYCSLISENAKEESFANFTFLFGVVAFIRAYSINMYFQICSIIVDSALRSYHYKNVYNASPSWESSFQMHGVYIWNELSQGTEGLYTFG